MLVIVPNGTCLISALHASTSSLNKISLMSVSISRIMLSSDIRVIQCLYLFSCLNYNKKPLIQYCYLSHRVKRVQHTLLCPQVLYLYFRQFQQELFQKYGHKILCINATHGTNAYRFQLITCIVPDEFGKGMCKLHM